MNKKPKHTREPMMAIPEPMHGGSHVAGEGPTVVIAKGGGRRKVIARCIRLDRVEFDADGRDPEAEANARLFAAAPHLLVACEKAIEALAHCDVPPGVEWMRKLIRDAIDQATSKGSESQ